VEAEELRGELAASEDIRLQLARQLAGAEGAVAGRLALAQAQVWDGMFCVGCREALLCTRLEHCCCAGHACMARFSAPLYATVGFRAASAAGCGSSRQHGPAEQAGRLGRGQQRGAACWE
jgi:hypothetical protein